MPIEGLFTFLPDLAGGLVDCGGGFVFPHLYRAKGDISHLGHTNVLITLDECWLEAEPVPHLVGVGTGEYTAANGDQLYGEYVMPTYLDPEGGPVATYDLDPIEYVGGTGRFDGVTGHAVGGGTMSIVTGAGSYWIQGMLASVGSLKQE